MTIAPPAPPQERLYTAEDLWAMPREARFELIEGKLEPMSPTGDWHGARTNRLSTYISVFIYENDLGEAFSAETGFLLARNPDVVLAPDFSYLSKARINFPRGFGYLPATPDLVIETRSPSDRATAIDRKISRWLHYGVKIVIDVDPSHLTLTVHRAGVPPETLGAEDTLTLPEVLPGFSLPLSRVF